MRARTLIQLLSLAGLIAFMPLSIAKPVDLNETASNGSIAYKQYAYRPAARRGTVNRATPRVDVTPRVDAHPAARTAPRNNIYINNTQYNLYVPGRVRLVPGARCYVVNYGYGTVVKSTCMYRGVYYKTFYLP